MWSSERSRTPKIHSKQLATSFSGDLRSAFNDPSHEYFLGRDTDKELISEELENKDYYTSANVFWVPSASRWSYVQDNIRLSVGSPLPLGGDFKGPGKLIDDSMELIEKENPKLKRILNKNYAQLQMPGLPTVQIGG